MAASTMISAIPASLFALPSLETLDVSSGNISGPLPEVAPGEHSPVNSVLPTCSHLFFTFCIILDNYLHFCYAPPQSAHCQAFMPLLTAWEGSGS